MGILSKEALLGASDLVEREVELPSIGGSVRVRSLPAASSNQAISEALEMVVGRRGDQTSRINTAKLEVIQVPGGHLGCLTFGAELLVDHLRQRIDGLADGAPPSLNRTRRGRMAGLACDDNQGALVRGELDALSPRDEGDLKGPIHQPT